MISIFNNEQYNKSLLRLLYSESILVFLLIFAPLVLRNTNNVVRNSIGDPSSIGFGWGIIFGGWVLYLPILLICFGMFAFYIVTIFFKIKYLKICLTSIIFENKYLYLLIFSWLMYTSVPILLLDFKLNKNIVYLSIFLIVIDILIIYSCNLSLAIQKE